MIAVTYLLASMVNSLIPLPQPPKDQNIIGWRGKIMWILFVMSANLQVVITIGYWGLVFDGNLKLYSVLAHGVVMVATIVDGMGVNAIPVRMRHWLEFLFPVGVAYGIWSYVHSLTDIGNPDKRDKDPETNDDLIYDVIDWQGNPGGAIIVVLLKFFVLSPLIQIFLWAFSGCRRRDVNTKIIRSPQRDLV